MRVYSDTMSGLSFDGDDEHAEVVSREYFMAVHFPPKSGLEEFYVVAELEDEDIELLKEKYGDF